MRLCSLDSKDLVAHLSLELAAVVVVVVEAVVEVVEGRDSYKEMPEERVE